MKKMCVVPYAAKASAGLALLGLLASGCFGDRQADSKTIASTSTKTVVETGSRMEVDGGGRDHLYREKIEIYWNDWWGIPAVDFEPPVGSDELRIEIVGEGKTVDFIGALSMNCMDDKMYWASGANFGDELLGNEIDRYVPLEVKLRARERFCPGK